MLNQIIVGLASLVFLILLGYLAYDSWHDMKKHIRR